jgi:hypothetical protein
MGKDWGILGQELFKNITTLITFFADYRSYYQLNLIA